VARSRSGFPARSRSRRMTAWDLGPNSVGQTISADGDTLWSNGIAVLEPKLTIVRIRGHVELNLQTAGTAGDGFFGALGIGVVTDQAFGIGITAVPSPLDESDWDGWMWHQFFSMHSITATIADGVNSRACTQRYQIDSKAMRIVEDSVTLFAAIGVTEAGASTLRLHADSRILIKLP